MQRDGFAAKLVEVFGANYAPCCSNKGREHSACAFVGHHDHRGPVCNAAALPGRRSQRRQRAVRWQALYRSSLLRGGDPIHDSHGNAAGTAHARTAGLQQRLPVRMAQVRETGFATTTHFDSITLEVGERCS